MQRSRDQIVEVLFSLSCILQVLQLSVWWWWEAVVDYRPTPHRPYWETHHRQKLVR